MRTSFVRKLSRPGCVAGRRESIRSQGADPALAKPDLDHLLAKRKNLIDVARPFMGNLYQFVASSSFVVLLCDERGYIMEAAGEPDVIQNAPDLNFCPGALWTEGEIGNNGVGTSLFLQRPFQVSGAEHYCKKHHPWTCSGAPIFNESGQMIGILEMSGPVEATHQHTLGMVVAATEAIQQQLRVHAKNRELMLLNSHLSNLFLTVSDGVVVIDAHGIIQQINPVAEKIFSIEGQGPGRKPFRPVRGQRRSGPRAACVPARLSATWRSMSAAVPSSRAAWLPPNRSRMNRATSPAA